MQSSRYESTYARGSALALALVLEGAGGIGCLSGEDVDLGRNVDAGATTAGLALDAAASDGRASLISAAITATSGTICQGACVELFATASGGTSPYTFSWGQDLGEGPGPKSVCPVASATYSVVASASSVEQESTASTMITVVACDSGLAAAPDGAESRTDGSGGPASAESICVSNPSFEGTTMIGMSGPPGSGLPSTAAPPDWDVCLGSPDIDPSESLLPPSDGMSYVGLAVGSGTFSAATESIGTTLCSALQVGTEYSFCLDLGIGVRGVTLPGPAPPGPSPTLQIWGGGSPCNQEELLWTSPQITNTDSWTRVCGSFVPSQALSGLSLVPALASTTLEPGSLSYVIVDHMVAGP
jgi:hypothetical protein